LLVETIFSNRNKNHKKKKQQAEHRYYYSFWTPSKLLDGDEEPNESLMKTTDVFSSYQGRNILLPVFFETPQCILLVFEIFYQKLNFLF
jgi:hypothetical protein